MGFLSGILGGSKSKSSSNSWVWDPQAQALSGLYNSAGAQLPMATHGIRDLTFGQDGGGGLLGSGLGMAGNLGMLGSIGNPFVMNQIGQLGNQLGSFWQNQIQPGIRSDFTGLGQLGSSRQAVAEGLATDSLFRNFASGAGDLLGQSAQLALGANQAGLESLGGLQSLGLGGYFGPYATLAGIYGNPTVLSNSTNKMTQQRGLTQGFSDLFSPFKLVAGGGG